MTDAHRKVKMLLLERMRPFRDLVKATGFSDQTLRNALNGVHSSPKVKQAIVNALRCDDLFEGFSVTDRHVRLEVGTIIHLPGAAMTAEVLKDVGDAGFEVRPNYVKIVQETSFKITVVADDDPRAGRLPSPNAGPIDIWPPESEAEALAEADQLNPKPSNQSASARGKRTRTPKGESLTSLARRARSLIALSQPKPELPNE